MFKKNQALWDAGKRVIRRFLQVQRERFQSPKQRAVVKSYPGIVSLPLLGVFRQKGDRWQCSYVYLLLMARKGLRASLLSRFLILIWTREKRFMDGCDERPLPVLEEGSWFVLPCISHECPGIAHQHLEETARSLLPVIAVRKRDPDG